MNSFYGVGFEMATELTFPEPESTSTGILISFHQLFGIILTVISGWMLEIIGVFWSLIMLSGALLFGNILIIFVPHNLKRQEEFNRNS